MLDVCYDPTTYYECTAMVGTGNECEHAAYLLSHGKLCYGGLLHGSVVPAKFLFGLFDTLHAEHETSNALVGLWSGERSTMRTTERDMAQTERAFSKDSFDTSSMTAVCIKMRQGPKSVSTSSMY